MPEPRALMRLGLTVLAAVALVALPMLPAQFSAAEECCSQGRCDLRCDSVCCRLLKAAYGDAAPTLDGTAEVEETLTLIRQASSCGKAGAYLQTSPQLPRLEPGARRGALLRPSASGWLATSSPLRPGIDPLRAGYPTRGPPVFPS